jgi:hypothetical protein
MAGHPSRVDEIRLMSVQETGGETMPKMPFNAAVLLFLMCSSVINAQKPNQPTGGATQPPSSSALPGLSYDQADWTRLTLPKMKFTKRYVACFEMNYGNSSAQPFVLIPVHPTNLEAAGNTGFDMSCSSVSKNDQEPEMQKWCKAHPTGSWSPCSPVDADHPILMGQTLVIGIDPHKISQDRLKILNFNITSTASSPINPTPIRPSFSSSGAVALAGGALYMVWPSQIPGDVIPTISVNLIYTPPVPGEAWTKQTFYPFGSIVTPRSRNGHYYMAVGSGISGSSEPVFPISLPSAVADGTIVWQDFGPASATGSGKAPGPWLASHSYDQGDSIIDPYNGHIYIAMNKGTSGALPTDPFSLPSASAGVSQPAQPPQTVQDGGAVWSATGGTCPTPWQSKHPYLIPASVGMYNGLCYTLSKPGTSGPLPVQPNFPAADAGTFKDYPTQPDSNKLLWIDLGVTPPNSISGAQAVDQTVNLLNLQLPQSHTLAYLNLASGVLYSTVHNRTFGIPSGTTNTGGQVETSTNATIEPVLIFTAYPWPADTESHCSYRCIWQTKPGVSVGLSLSNPSGSFYAGTSLEVIRNVQLVLAWNWQKTARLPSPSVSLASNATSAVTVQKFENGPAFGLTFNVSGFIQSLFGGGGSGSKSNTSGSQ